MSELPESFVIDGETITPEMVKRIAWERPAVHVLGPNDFISGGQVISGDGRRYYGPGPVTYLTLYLHDGRVLETEVYN